MQINLFGLAPWVVFFPLLGLVINLLVGKTLGEKFSGGIASLAVGASFVVSVLLALSLAGDPQMHYVRLGDWITAGPLSVGWVFRVDTLAVTMMLVVSGVGTLIHVYSIGYMHHDVRHNGDPGRYTRFFVYLNLFIAAMMVLVSADNFLMMFVGWEGVGLCSYLLIGFWFEKGADGIGNARAAKKAFIVNRIGDFGLLIALFLIFATFGSLQYDEVFAKVMQISAINSPVIVLITLFMLLAVTGKSAQVPLYVWLPDAMAGPTPVSALIHAATMVTAGVYLVTRSNPLYSAAPAAQAVVAWVGAATALFAATIAVAQADIKKVLAYSTISQLGYMVAAVGMGAYAAGMFHLVTHSFFKALLFLAAGSVILGMEHGEDATQHAAQRRAGKGSKKQQQARAKEQFVQGALVFDAEHDEQFDPQDMWNMGGLRERQPVTFWVYLIGALALAGIFPLSGFFSKDEILGEAFRLQPGIFWVLLVAAFLTAFYIGRQVCLVFLGKPRTEGASRSRENPSVILVPLVILAALAAFGGAINLPGVQSLEHWLEHTIANLEPGQFSLLLAGGALLVAGMGLLVAWAVYGQAPLAKAQPDPLRRALGPLYIALEHKWWVDELYDRIIVRPYKGLAAFLSSGVDMGVIDYLGDALARLTASLADALRRLQTGLVRMYALAFLFGAVVVLAFLAFSR
ncbi:MAG TPA: NADH-quinone oxidoreductase subunit L [Anaerolineaceae bacterium]|nr:NADH-quinone oxidoreductase subunit L [Anaerolineaceae bacterium]